MTLQSFLVQMGGKDLRFTPIWKAFTPNYPNFISP